MLSYTLAMCQVIFLPVVPWRTDPAPTKGWKGAVEQHVDKVKGEASDVWQKMADSERDTIVHKVYRYCCFAAGALHVSSGFVIVQACALVGLVRSTRAGSLLRKSSRVIEHIYHHQVVATSMPCRI